MSYDLNLLATRRGAAREMLDPFTGKNVVQSPLEMNDEELDASLAVLRRHGGGLDEEGWGLVELDGAALELSALERQGYSVGVRGALRVACGVLFELAHAGGLAIVPDDGAGFVTNADALARADQLDDELGPVTLVEGADALAARLGAGQERAVAYTARVVHES